ncbi:TPR-like protein [Coprinopsis marcescibilis]|uniref:TPR-like protein n=1 Tax=Coprinopsis marcescibilis TaxID=230819 RepID=A0A5C3KWB6_COPMA|nr:TPR-like protein [Coprinopsis marcescibilis]
MHKFKVLRRTLRVWKSVGEDTGPRQEMTNTNTGASSSQMTGSFAGASNFSIQDSQFNVVGGNMVHSTINVTNVTNVTQEIQESYSCTDAEICEALRRLNDPVGCSWNASRVCLVGTRTVHIEEISVWEAATSSCNSAEIYVVADSAGSGKSALAHTISQKARREGTLVSSFFFDQMKQHSTPSNMMAALIRGLCDVSDSVKRQIGEIIAKDHSLANADPIQQFEEIVLPICPALPQGRRFTVTIDALDEDHSSIIVTILRDWVPRLPPSFRIFLTTRPESRIMKQLEKQPHIRLSSNSLTGLSQLQDVKLFITASLSKTKYGPSISAKLLEAFIAKSEGLFLWATMVLRHIDDAYDPAGELQDIIAGSSDDWKEADGAVKQLDSLYQRILLKLRWTDRRFVEKYKIVMGALVTLKEPLSAAGLAALYESDCIAVDDIHRICGLLQPLLRDYSSEDPQKPIQLLHLSVQEYLTQRASLPYRLDCDEHHSRLGYLALRIIKSHLTSQNVPILGYTDGEWFRDITSVPPPIPPLLKDDVLEQLWYSCQHVGTHMETMPTTGTTSLHAEFGFQVLVNEPRSILEVTASMGSLIKISPLKKLALVLSGSTLESSSIRRTAAIYCAVARCLVPLNRFVEARPLIEDAVSLYRDLFSEDTEDAVLGREFALSLYNLSVTLQHFGSHEEGRRIAQEGIGIVRRLAHIQPLHFQALLSKLLRTCSVLFSKAGLHENALGMALEDTEITRKLTGSHLSQDLAQSLSNLRDIHMELDRHEDAIPPIVEAVQIYRQLTSSDPEKYNVALADSLYKHSQSLCVNGNYTDALGPAQESLAIRQTLAKEDPEASDEQLVLTLRRVSYILLRCKRSSDAIPTSIGAVAVGRRLAAKDEQFQSQLAHSLHLYGANLSMIGKPFEAIEATKEAVAIRRRLISQGRISMIDTEESLGLSLHNLGCQLGKLDDYDNAILPALESIEINRRLVATNLTKYEGQLSDSLRGYSFYLSNMGRNIEAVEAVRESLQIRRRMAASRSNSAEMDEPLAGTLCSLAYYLGQGKFYDEALPFDREAIEIWRRVVNRDTSFEKHLASSLHNFGVDLSMLDQYVEAIGCTTEAVDIYRRLASLDGENALNYFAKSLENLATILCACDRSVEAKPFSLEAIEIRRRLVEKDVNSEDHLAASLHILASCLPAKGQNAEAIVYRNEEVAIRRRLVERKKTPLNKLELAQSLNEYAWCLTQTSGPYSDAVAYAQESAAKYRQILAEKPGDAEISLDLANVMDTKAHALNLCQRYDEAIKVSEEGLILCVKKGEGEPSVNFFDFPANVLHQRCAEAFYSIGRYEDALRHVEEAVVIGRRLVVEGNTGRDRETLSESLVLLEKIRSHLETPT